MPESFWADWRSLNGMLSDIALDTLVRLEDLLEGFEFEGVEEGLCTNGTDSLLVFPLNCPFPRQWRDVLVEEDTDISLASVVTEPGDMGRRAPGPRLLSPEVTLYWGDLVAGRQKSSSGSWK
jgi:hypothetical protein